MSLFNRKSKPVVSPKPAVGSLRAEVDWEKRFGWCGHIYVYAGRRDYNEGWELWSWWAEGAMQWINLPVSCRVNANNREEAERWLCVCLNDVVEYMKAPQLKPSRSILYPGDCA